MKKLLLLFFIICCTSPFITQGQYITTIAGNDSLANTGDGGPASLAEVTAPRAVCVDGKGNIYFACTAPGNLVRKINPAGIISTFAGSDSSGYLGDGGQATLARLNSPRQIACDNGGNIYIADELNNCVRKVDTAGIITTFAGTGTAGYDGDSGLATAALLYEPTGIFFDAAGNAYIADELNQAVRKIDTGGIIYTIAGTGVAGYSGDNGPAVAAQLNKPYRMLAVGSDIYFSELNNNCIRKIDDAGIITTFAGDGTGAPGYYGDGGPASACELNFPASLCADKEGNIYISDVYNFVIRKINFIDGLGYINTFAGNGNEGYNGDCIPATAAELDAPYGVAADTAGNIYIADNFNNRIRKVFDGQCLTAVNSIPDPGGSIHVFPNPASGELTISASGMICQVMIMDMVGQEVFSRGYNDGKVTVNVGALPTGVYLVKVNGSAVSKFVKE